MWVLACQFSSFFWYFGAMYIALCASAHGLELNNNLIGITVANMGPITEFFFGFRKCMTKKKKKSELYYKVLKEEKQKLLLVKGGITIFFCSL